MRNEQWPFENLYSYLAYLVLLCVFFANMSYLDIIIAVPLLWGLYRGFTRGFVIELAALLSLFFGIWGAIKFSDFVTVYCRENFNWTSDYLPLLSFAITFILIVLLVYLIAKVIEQFIRLAALGIVNRIFGAVFCVVKFVIIISCFIYAINSVQPSGKIISEEQQQKSLLYKHVASVAPAVIPAFRESKLGEGYPLSVVSNQ